MGAGGRMSDPPSGKKTAAEALKRAPHEKPPFTIGDLKKAIPAHCFQKSLVTSFRYLIQDLFMAYALFYVATNYIDQYLPTPFNYVAWAAYIAVQGCVLTGAWVVGHECDHDAFSNYNWINDLVGLVVHSSLLVPYFSWKISHRRHHANTQSLENDEVYVPRFKSNIRNYYKLLNNPPGRVLVWLTTLLIGFPLYLMFNVSGHKYERWTSHYDPHSPLYSDRERKEIIVSDIAILAVIYDLYQLVLAKGFAWVFCVYGGPLLVVNGWFVLYTILNHTHPSLPYYDSTEWDWLRGALCTVDRDYGILNKVFHNVCNAHVCHHIFSMIPHYHGLESTEAMKPILGEYYQYDGTPILKAMYREMKECIYVEKDEGETKGVYWYRNKF
uniref:Fungal elicitor-induced protein n=1 Tax=Petroselinum crispum TaxID=4043 RepID=O24472_PETCR|nr:fungal elicitor-induced protein [Petroselinum crispum]